MRIYSVLLLLSALLVAGCRKPAPPPPPPPHVPQLVCRLRGCWDATCDFVISMQAECPPDVKHAWPRCEESSAKVDKHCWTMK